MFDTTNLRWITRSQRPVGQGLFHYSSFSKNSSEQPWLDFVYDCGSTESYKVDRNREVQLLAKESQSRPIDILFISHADHDHVSGIPELSNLGVKFRTIMLPHLDVGERLICLARAIATSRATAIDPAYLSFVVDPTEALRALRPERIILLHRGTDPSPFAERPDDSPPEPLPDGRSEYGYTFVGSQPSPVRSQDAQIDGVNVFECGDDTSLAIDGAGWILSPFVAAAVRNQTEHFKRKLFSELQTKSAQAHRVEFRRLPQADARKYFVTPQARKPGAGNSARYLQGRA